MKLSYLEYKGLPHYLCSIPPIWYMIWTTFKGKSRVVSIPVTNFGSQLTALFVNVRMQNSFQERKKMHKEVQNQCPHEKCRYIATKVSMDWGSVLNWVWKRAQRQSLKNPKMGFVIKHLNNLYHNRRVKELSWAIESFPNRWWCHYVRSVSLHFFSLRASSLLPFQVKVIEIALSPS